MNRPSRQTIVFLAILGLAGTLFLLPLPHGWSVGWRGELINRMHAPLMGVCFATLTVLLRQSVRPMRSLWLAAVCAAVMAAMVECVQPWFDRTGSLEDFLWGMAGVLGGFLWQGAELIQSAAVRCMSRLLAVVCLAAPPLVWWTQVSLIQAEARRLFPVLADRSYPLESAGPSLAQTSPASSDPLLLARNADHPASLHLDTLDRDWSGYTGLEISGTLQAAAAVEVGVRLDLGKDGSKRLRAGGWMQPGTSVIQIDWPRDAPVALVHQLVVFLAADPSAATLQIHRLRLIKIKASAPHEPTMRKPGAKKEASAGLQDARIAQ